MILNLFIGLMFVSVFYRPPLAHGAMPPAATCGFSVTALDKNDNPLQGKDDHTIYYYGINSRIRFSFDLGKIPADYWKQFNDDRHPGTPNFFDRQLKMTWAEGYICKTDYAAGTLNTTSAPSSLHDPAANWGAACQFNFKPGASYPVSLYYIDDTGAENQLLCRDNFTVEDSADFNALITVQSDNGLDDVTSKWNVTISNISIPYSYKYIDTVDVLLDDSRLTRAINSYTLKYTNPAIADGGNLPASDIYGNPVTDTIHFTLNSLPLGTHTIKVQQHFVGLGDHKLIQTKQFTVLKKGEPTLSPIPIPPQCTGRDTTCSPSNCGLPTSQCYVCPGCPGFGKPHKTSLEPELTSICQQFKEGTKFKSDCEDCHKQGKLWTAIGCIQTNLQEVLAKYIFTTGIGIAGGLAFLYFLYGAFLILTSAGNPEAVDQGRQIITSAIIGLLLIIFSVMILRIIGYDILRIPGFS